MMRGKKKARLKLECMELYITYGEREFNLLDIIGEYGVLLGEGLINWTDTIGAYVKLTPKALELIRS